MPSRFAASLAATLALVVLLPAAAAEARVAFKRVAGAKAPGTPAQYNRVGMLMTGSARAENVLVFVPGTSASAAYLQPMAEKIVKANPDWQVWGVERRENLLEDHSASDALKAGTGTAKQVYDYYLGHLQDPSVQPHYENVPDASVPFARDWGMRVAVEDIRAVVKQAQKRGGKVVLGGHSLGGTITTAYATWDFRGKAGADDLDGLVYVDGGSNPAPIGATELDTSLQALRDGSPWLAFGGIAAPFAGLFNIVAAEQVKAAPDAPNTLADFRLLPGNLRPPVPVTNAGGYGYALDVKTSPPSLAAAQVHAGQLAAEGDPRGWDNTGALSPLQDVATSFAGWPIKGLDGTAWYHPRRLTIDAGTVAAGNANPQQQSVGVRATHGDDIPKMPIYAFAAALGGDRVLLAARALARQSGIRGRDVVLVNRKDTYAHIDPITAGPRNDLVTTLRPVLNRIAG